jgi:hypothetical protein
LQSKLQITVGTPEENEQLMKALRFIAGLKHLSRCNGRLKGGNNSARPQFGSVSCSAERASRGHVHHCRDKLHAIAGIIIFTCEPQQNIIPNATCTGEGFTSFPRCYPTLMKVRETLTNSITSTDDEDVILGSRRGLMAFCRTSCGSLPTLPLLSMPIRHCLESMRAAD